MLRSDPTWIALFLDNLLEDGEKNNAGMLISPFYPLLDPHAQVCDEMRHRIYGKMNRSPVYGVFRPDKC